MKSARTSHVPGQEPEAASLLLHVSPRVDACAHDFRGWRDLYDEAGDVAGGEQVCIKCGIGAMAYTLRTGA